MKISDLYGTLPESVWIIGTGPSMDLFPESYLRDKYCILLNDATREFPELGPVAFANRRDFLDGSQCPIKIVKGRLRFDPHPERDDNHCSWDDPEHYVFSYHERPWDQSSHFDESRYLFNPKYPCHYWNTPGGSVSIFAAQFAVRAGAKVIYLVGCDCCQFQGAGKPLNYVRTKKQRRGVHREFKAYAQGMLRLSQVAKERYDTVILSLTPFYGLGYHQEQWELLRPVKG